MVIFLILGFFGKTRWELDALKITCDKITTDEFKLFMNCYVSVGSACGVAEIYQPLVNASNLIGKDVNFSCLVRGVQESYQQFHWTKVRAHYYAKTYIRNF